MSKEKKVKLIVSGVFFGMALVCDGIGLYRNNNTMLCIYVMITAAIAMYWFLIYTDNAPWEPKDPEIEAAKEKKRLEREEAKKALEKEKAPKGKVIEDDFDQVMSGDQK